MRFAAFDPLCPPADKARGLAAVPYDVVNSEEARVLAAGNPDSFLRISRAEIDLPPDTPPYDHVVYRKSAENFAEFKSRGLLNPFGRRTIFIYRQAIPDHEQYSVVGCCHAQDYENDIIKKHEKTRKDKEDDRTNHVLTLRCHSGLLLLTYRDDAQIDGLVKEAIAGKTLYDFEAVDGVRHTVWEAPRPQDFVAAFEKNVPCCYIADGHHRAASAWRAAAAYRAEASHYTGKEEFNWFTGALFPASQLRILPYNRLVADLNGQSASEFLAALTKQFTVTSPAPSPSPKSPGEFCVYLAGQWHHVAVPAASIPKNDPIGSLDVSILQDRVLKPMLAIDDPRTNKRIDFVGGIRGTDELERAVNSGRAAVAFSMFPTRVDQVMSISDAGAIMPPKSTWFEPKLRSGLLVHTF